MPSFMYFTVKLKSKCIFKKAEMFDAESYIMWHLRIAVGVDVWCMLRI